MIRQRNNFKEFLVVAAKYVNEHLFCALSLSILVQILRSSAVVEDVGQ